MKILHDSILPANYLHYKDIGRSEGIKEEKMSEYARGTLDILSSKFVELGFTTWPKFAAYYNTHANGMTTNKEINLFLWHTKLQPFGHLFRLFVKNRATRTGSVNLYCDFGILRSHYERYQKTGEVLDVLNCGRLNKTVTPIGEHDRAKIRFDRALDIPRTEVYERFITGVRSVNKRYPDDKMTVPQVAIAAFAEYMDKRPEIFEAHEIIVDEGLIRKKNAKSIVAEVSPEISELASAVVERYNAKNIAPITLSDFVAMAIKAHLERLPVEYTDPELARRIEELVR